MLQHSTAWITVAIALPIIIFVAIVALALILLRRHRRKQAQSPENGDFWEHGPLIIVNQTTDVHTDARQSVLRKPTSWVPRPWRSSGREATVPGMPTRGIPSIRSSDESFISIQIEHATTDTNPDCEPHVQGHNTVSSSYHTPHSPTDSEHNENLDDECMSSSSHDTERAVPRLAVRIPQWPAWLPRWPSSALSRKESSSLGHSPSTKSEEPYPHLKFQPPRIVRLEPSFLREYRPLKTHAHSDSTAPLLASAAPPGMSDATPSVPEPPQAPAVPHTDCTHLGDAPSTPPLRTPSVPGSLRPGSRPPSSLAPTPSVSSSVVARFPAFDSDSQPTSSGSGSLSRTSTAPSEFAENGRLPNPFVSSASPWRAVLSVVGETSTGDEGCQREPGIARAGSAGSSRPTSPGSPLARLRSQHAFRAMPLYLEPTAEERPASVAASAHGRTLSSTTVPTLSSKPSYSASTPLITPHSSYSAGASAAQRAHIT